MSAQFQRLPPLRDPTLLPEGAAKFVSKASINAFAELVGKAAVYYARAQELVDKLRGTSEGALQMFGLHLPTAQCPMREDLVTDINFVMHQIGEYSIPTQMLYGDFVGVIARAADSAIHLRYKQSGDQSMLTNTNEGTPISAECTLADLSAAYDHQGVCYLFCINEIRAQLKARPTLRPTINALATRYLDALIGHLFTELRIGLYQKDPQLHVGTGDDFQDLLVTAFKHPDVVQEAASSERLQHVPELFEHVGNPSFLFATELAQFYRMVMLLAITVGDFPAARSAIAVLQTHDATASARACQLTRDVLKKIDP